MNIHYLPPGKLLPETGRAIHQFRLNDAYAVSDACG